MFITDTTNPEMSVLPHNPTFEVLVLKVYRSQMVEIEASQVS